MTTEEFALFQKLYDERFNRLFDDVKDLKETFVREVMDVKKDVREIRSAQVASDKVVANLSGKWAVWGVVGLALGGVLAAAVIKGLGI